MSLIRTLTLEQMFNGFAGISLLFYWHPTLRDAHEKSFFPNAKMPDTTGAQGVQFFCNELLERMFNSFVDNLLLFSEGDEPLAKQVARGSTHEGSLKSVFFDQLNSSSEKLIRKNELQPLKLNPNPVRCLAAQNSS